jgi:YbbR domain-containing protein
VAIACTSWFIVNNQDVLRQKYEVPIEYRNLSENYVISGERQETVDVWIRGTARLLKRITPGFNMVAVVDLSNILKGEKEVRITEKDISLPSQRLGVFKIYPTVISVNIEEVKRKTVEVFPDFEGTVREGYDLVEWQIAPSQIQIQGPESIINRTFTAITDPILLEGRDKSMTKEVNIRIDPQLQNLSESQAQVSVKIAEEEVEAALSGIKLNIVPGKYQFELSAETITVTLAGPRSKIKALSSEAIRAELPLEDLMPSRQLYEVEPRIILPEAIKHKESSPPVIRVRILDKEIEALNSKAARRNKGHARS